MKERVAKKYPPKVITIILTILNSYQIRYNYDGSKTEKKKDSEVDFTVVIIYSY